MADTKVTGLTAIASPALTDLLYVVSDPGGTPASRNTTLANIKTMLGIGALTDWTPTVTQGVTVTKTVTYAKYCRLGPLVYLCANMTITSAGTNGSVIAVSNLPVQVAFGVVYGTAIVDNAGTAYYIGAAYIDTSEIINFYAHLETSAIGADPSFALANTDRILFFALYPAA